MESVSPSAPTSLSTGGAIESDNASLSNNMNSNANAHEKATSNNDERVITDSQESVHSFPPPVINKDKETLFMHKTAAPSSSTTDGDGEINNNTQQQQQQNQIPTTKSSNHSSLPPLNNNPSSTPIAPPLISSTALNEEKIDKATSFLRNTEIHNVSTLEKRNYLKEKVGMTSNEIDVAFDRVADGSGRSGRDDGRGMNMDMGTSNIRDDKNSGQSRERQGYNRDNNGRFENDGRQQGGYKDQYPNQQQNNDSYNHHGQERRSPPSQQYNASNNNDPTYNNNMQTQPQGNMYSPQGGGPMAHEELPPPQPSIFPSGWMGGFSLGIFCLAAIRWLNGGDFILFPPPTSLESTRATMEGGFGLQKEESTLLDGEDEATDESDSQQHHEEEENGLQQREEEDNVDYQEGEEYEVESNEEDDGINMILNGTSNAQNLHHPNNSQQQQQPSYDELALEIRALTSAIHTYRDVQERSNRAVTAHVGRGMTDDAMDFLREDKKKKSEEVEDESKSTEEVCLNEENVIMIAKLLEDVSCDLSKLKESLAVQCEDKCGNDDSEKQGEDSDDSKGTDSNEKTLNSEEKPLEQIDKVMEKVKQMMAMMDNVKPKEQESVTSKEDDSNKGDSAVETENKGISDDSTTALMASPATDKQGDEKTTTPSTSESSTQEQSSIEEATQQTATTPPPPTTTMEQLEEALKRLANNNITNLKVGAQMLYLYCLNISKNPSVPRYRKIYTNNSTFRNKVGNLDGAKEFLVAVGFVERASFFEWGVAVAASEESGSKSKLDFALVALEMMKNGSTNKPSNSDGADTVTVEAVPTLAEKVPLEPKEVTVPTLAEDVPMESTEVTSSEAISAAVSIAGLAGKGIDLN